MAKIETAIIDQHNAKPLSSADAPAGYPYKNMAIIEKIESAWGTIGRGLPSLFPLPIVPRALSFSFSPASPQHKEASVKERDTKPLVWKRYVSLLSMTCFPYWTLIKRRLTHAFTKEQDLKRNISLTPVLILSLLRHSSTHILNPVIHTRSKKASWRVKASQTTEKETFEENIKRFKLRLQARGYPSNQ